VKPIAVITHADRPVAGLVDEIAGERGHTCRVVRPYRGEQLPGLDDVGALVIMGGPQSAYEDHPYLRLEGSLLSNAVDAGVPVLAICLGAQILARALGGTAQPGKSGVEAGFIRVKPCAQQLDTASIEVAGEFFSFHSDSMTPPEGAEILAASDRYLQAWSAGSALAVQFHPEMTLDGVQDLLAIEGPKIAQCGVDVPAIHAEAERYFAAGAPDSRNLLHGWFDRIDPDFPRN
jgi:GMP synthase (glutamine-hydrolysing)